MNRAELVRIWWRDIRVLLPLFILLAGTFAGTHLDLHLAHALFFDAALMRWAGADSWWANEFLHTGGRWAVRAAVAAALLLWTATWLRPEWRAPRRSAAYFAVTAVLSVGLVGLLKSVTNVHCPWDLTEFGGRFPFVELFSPRDAALAHGKCFPAAHSSAGYALMALYFALRERGKALRRTGLAAGVFTGVVFGIAQQSRGAHFFSHDLWSAFIVWTVCASMYAFAFRARLWQDTPDEAAEPTAHESPVAGSPVHSDALGLGGGARGFPRPARE